MLATADDIAARLGRSLGANETDPVALLLEMASASIAAAVDKDDDWAPDPVPGLVKAICVELVCRAMANPQNLLQMQEGLGAHNIHMRFRPDGILPNEMETRMLRRAVFGSNTASARANDLANHIGIDPSPWDPSMVYVDEDVIAS